MFIFAVKIKNVDYAKKIIGDEIGLKIFTTLEESIIDNLDFFAAKTLDF